MVYEERQVVPRKSAKWQIFPITNSRFSASLVLNCINFLFQNFWFLIFFWKKYALKKKVYSINFVQFWILYSDIFFFCLYSVFECSDKFPIISSDEKRDRRCLRAPIELLHRSPQLKSHLNGQQKILKCCRRIQHSDYSIQHFQYLD